MQDIIEFTINLVSSSTLFKGVYPGFFFHWILQPERRLAVSNQLIADHISTTTSAAFFARSNLANTPGIFRSSTSPSVPLPHILSTSSFRFDVPISRVSRFRCTFFDSLSFSNSFSLLSSASSHSTYPLAAAPGASLLNSATRVDWVSNSAYRARSLSARRGS